MAIGIGGALLGSSIAGGIGSLLSSGLQLASQAWSQDFNRKEAEKSRQFSHDEAELNRNFEAQQAEINRQWQTDMSNSAYQRSMTDMQQAGLNPNLMSGGLQASTGSSGVPQGSQASSASASSSPTHFGNMLTGLTSALNAYATLQNQTLIAEMYNHTSLSNNSLNNKVKQYGIDSYTNAYQSVNRQNFYKQFRNQQAYYSWLKEQYKNNNY